MSRIVEPPRSGKTKALLAEVEQALATGKRVLFVLGDQLEAEPVFDRTANAIHNMTLAKLLETYPDQFLVKSIADLRTPEPFGKRRPARYGEDGYEEEQAAIERRFQQGLADVEEQFREEKRREAAGLPPSDLDDDEMEGDDA